MRRVGGAV
jgi:ribonuclease HI